jgi:ABC-type glycerol-3-phosphate transport system substrate-binding protein
MLKKLIGIGILICIITPIWLQAQDEASQKSAGDLLYEIIQSEGVEAAVQKYRQLRRQPSPQHDLNESVLNRLGYRMIQENRVDDALLVFELNAETYPGSINVWDSLAEGYFNTGQKEKAEKYYNKVLKMLEADTVLSPPFKNFFRNNAEMQLFNLRHFEPPATAGFHYDGFFGGFPAGKWDMENLAEFQKESGISLSYRGTNLYQSPVPAGIASSFKGKHPANAVHSFIGGDYGRLVREGKITDISHLWEKEGWSRQFPNAFKQMASVEGKQYFLPMAYQWNPIWYRKDIFEKEGLRPPKTWDELLELCVRLNELGYTPFTIAVQQWPPPVARWFTILNLRLNGPEFHERLMRGEISYKNEKVRNVFVHWKELFQKQAFADSSWSNTYATALQELNSGKAVMYNLGEWLFESLDEEQGAKLDFFPFPEIYPELPSAEIVHAYGAFIPAGSDQPEQSEELLRWLSTKKSQQSNAESNDRTVAHAHVDPSVYTDHQKRIINYVNSTEVLVPLFEMNTHPDFARAAFPIFQDFWKTQDIDRALDALESSRKKIFK